MTDLKTRLEKRRDEKAEAHFKRCKKDYPLDDHNKHAIITDFRAGQDDLIPLVVMLVEKLQDISSNREWITPEVPTLRNWKDVCSLMGVEAELALAELEEFLKGAE